MRLLDVVATESKVPSLTAAVNTIPLLYVHHKGRFLFVNTSLLRTLVKRSCYFILIPLPSHSTPFSLQPPKTKRTSTPNSNSTASSTLPTMAQPAPNDTFKIYYGGPEGNNSSLPASMNTAAIRHLELYYHLQKNARVQEPITRILNADTTFKGSPIWHFVSLPGTKPSLDIILTHEGRGKLPNDYMFMLLELEQLMHELMASGFAHVAVTLRGESGPFGNKKERKWLRETFENHMGPADELDGGQECRMLFDLAAYYDEWLETEDMEETEERPEAC